MRRTLMLLIALALTGLVLLPPPAGASSATPRADQAVSLDAIRATAEVGRRVKLQGRAGPSSTVKVQRRYGKGAWETLETRKTDAMGRYKTKIELTQPGATSFRVAQGKAKSKVRSTEVFGWLDLTEQPYFQSDAPGFVSSPLSIGGKVFPTTFHSYGGAFRSFDISGCTKVEGWTGFVDGSGATGADTQELQWNSGVYDEMIPAPPAISTPVGPAVRRSIAVAGDNILYIDLDVTQAAGQEQAVMGSPRAYCNVASLKTPPLPFLRSASRWSVR